MCSSWASWPHPTSSRSLGKRRDKGYQDTLDPFHRQEQFSFLILYLEKAKFVTELAHHYMFPAGPPMQSLQLENKSRATQQCAQPSTEPSNRPASLCCRQKQVLSVVTTCSETDFSFLGHSDFCLSRVQLILCLSHFFPTCSFSGNLECHQSQTRLHKLMLAKLNIVSMSYSYRELGSHIQYGTPALRRNLPKDFFCKQPPLPKHVFTVTTATPG